MKYIKKALPVMISALMLFSGCEINGEQVYFTTGCGRNTVFMIGKEDCSVKEAKIYLYNYKNSYSDVGGESFWNGSYDLNRMTAILKESVLDSLSLTYALSIYAEENEIALSEDEEERVTEAAKEYFGSLTNEEKKAFGVSEKDIKSMYERYALSRKVYNDLMNSVDEEVSEDEARVMDAYVFYVTGEDKADEVMRALDTTPFPNVAVSYSEGSDPITVSFPRNTYPAEVEDAIFRLDNEEVATMLSDGEGHYYFAECISKYNAELSEANKSAVIGSRQQAVLDGIIEEQNEKYFSDFNTELWDELDIDETANIITNSFFTVLNDYMPI